MAQVLVADVEALARACARPSICWTGCAPSSRLNSACPARHAAGDDECRRKCRGSEMRLQMP
jgi:hypothetical protein